MFCAVCARSDHSAAHLSRSSARWLTARARARARSRGCSPSGAYASPPPSRRSTRRFLSTSRFRGRATLLENERVAVACSRERKEKRIDIDFHFVGVGFMRRLDRRLAIVVSRRVVASPLRRARERAVTKGLDRGRIELDGCWDGHGARGSPAFRRRAPAQFDRTVGRRCFSIGPESAPRSFNHWAMRGKIQRHLCAALRWTTRARCTRALESARPGPSRVSTTARLVCAEKSDPRQK